MMMRIFLRSLFLIQFAMFLAPEPVRADGAARHIIVAVDFTESAKQDADKYWKTIDLVTGCQKSMGAQDRKICEKIQPKDHIVVFKISDHTRRNIDKISELYLEEMSLMENKIKYQNRIAKEKVKFRNDIQAAFDRPVLAKTTEIIAGIREAAQQFKKENAREKYLVILSDMVEESEYYNFAKKKVDAGQILKKEADEGRLPDLKGVKVYVSGATAKNESKMDEIRKFWLEYFKITGADLNEINYSNQLSKFP
jgi:hypothetical protein